MLIHLTFSVPTHKICIILCVCIVCVCSHTHKVGSDLGSQREFLVPVSSSRVNKKLDPFPSASLISKNENLGMRHRRFGQVWLAVNFQNLIWSNYYIVALIRERQEKEITSSLHSSDFGFLVWDTGTHSLC